MRHVLVVFALVCALLATAVTAQAQVVVGVGIAGVRLGDSAAAVKRKLGKPQSVMHRAGSPESVYNYTRRKIVLRVRNGRGVIEINSFNSRDKTAQGVGVGSLLSAVDKAYPGACQLQYAPHCAIAKTVNGRKTSTQFDAGTSRDQRRVGAVKVQWLLPVR